MTVVVRIEAVADEKNSHHSSGRARKGLDGDSQQRDSDVAAAAAPGPVVAAAAARDVAGVAADTGPAPPGCTAGTVLPGTDSPAKGAKDNMVLFT